MSHSWCRDIPRDEAVRAAEDGRSGPLPTLDECIERQKHAAMTAGVKEGFVKADGEWKRLTENELRQLLVIPKSVSASSAVEPENKGDSMRPPTTKTATVENDFADGPKCSPAVSETGEGQSGLRTERVVPPAPESRPAETRQTKAERIGGGWWFPKYDLPSPPPPPPPAPPRVPRGSGVFDANGDEVPWEGVVAALTDERDAAIRERDEAKARVEVLIRQRDLFRKQLESAPAASGAAGTVPVAWGILRGGHFIVATVNEIAANESCKGYGGTVVPLYAAQPPARSWLSEKERGALKRAFDLLCDDDGDNPLAGTVQKLLARSSPPEVVLPVVWREAAGDVMSADEVCAALASAGVPCKEVGRE